MRLAMDKYAVGGVLAGSVEGRRAFSDLVSHTEIPTKPEPYFLDFKGITYMTSSFLRDGIIAYRNHARSAWPFLYPVVANTVPAVQEEFETWLAETNDAFVMCDLGSDGVPLNVTLLGVIDGKQLVALRGVIDLGETDVSSLAKHVGEDVAPTAWNNRLGALVAKGLVIEVTTGGRNKRYRPILEGLKYGT